MFAASKELITRNLSQIEPFPLLEQEGVHVLVLGSLVSGQHVLGDQTHLKLNELGLVVEELD